MISMASSLRSELRYAACACGASVVSLEGETKLNALCHCENCRKRTGSAFGHSLYFHRSALGLVRGQTQVYSLRNEGGEQSRHFCSRCGTTLYWYWSRFPEWVGVAGGCIEGGAAAPGVSACHRNKLVWVEVPAHCQHY